MKRSAPVGGDRHWVIKGRTCGPWTPRLKVIMGIIAGVSLVVGPRAAAAATDLGTLSDPSFQYPTPPTAIAYGVNDSGQIVGQADMEDKVTGQPNTQAAVWTPPSSPGGTYTSAGLGGTQSVAHAVNNAGEIVGTDVPTSTQRAAVWTPAGAGYSQEYLEPDVHGAAPGVSQAYGVNDQGQVVGQHQLTGPSFSPPIAVVWNRSAGGAYLPTDLPVGANSPELESIANSIDDTGRIVGWADDGIGDHALVWTPGGLGGGYDVTQLIDPPGSHSQAVAVNDVGEVVGVTLPSFGAARAALWRPLAGPGGGHDYGPPVDLGTLGGSGAQAMGINHRGQIVGESLMPGSATQHATLWTPSPTGDGSFMLRDLGTLGGAQAGASGINAAGQIAGWSEVSGGIGHAALWSPRLVVSGTPAGPLAGVPAGFTVTAEDAAGNPMPGYAGMVHFTSSDPSAVLPADVPLFGGAGSFQTTWNTPGTQSLTATDTSLASITGTQTGIGVVAAADLSVAKAGSGSGTVTSSPAGIACGLRCVTRLPLGTSVSLSAAAAPGSAFAGWSGAGCSGTGGCTAVLSGDAAVTATFTGTGHSLGIIEGGRGAGTVTSSPAGISCGTGCQQLFASGSSVTLTASPAVGSSFAGWSGAGCSGTGACTVALDADKNVTATFRQPLVTLSTAALDFGSRQVASTGDPQLVGVTNSGDAPLSVTGVSAAPADYTAAGCGGALAAGARCGIAVRFSPALAGSRPGTLSLTDNAVGSPQSVSLAGGGLVALSGHASALYAPQGLTLLGGTAAPVHVPSGGEAICEAGPLTTTGASSVSGSGLGCGGMLLPGTGVSAVATSEAVATGTQACPGACARSQATSVQLLAGMGPGGTDVLDAVGLDARSTVSCGSSPAGSSSVARLTIAGQTVATQPVGSRIIFNPTGRNPITLYGNPVSINPTGGRVPMAIVTLNYSRYDPVLGSMEASPVSVDFPAGGALSSLIVGRVDLSYARSGVQGCRVGR